MPQPEIRPLYSTPDDRRYYRYTASSLFRSSFPQRYIRCSSFPLSSVPEKPDPEQRLQELKRDDLLSPVHYRLDGRHPHILKTFQMSQIALAERHEEADPLNPRNIDRQRFDLLMMEQIHVLLS